MRMILLGLLAIVLSSCATPYRTGGAKAGGDTVVICHKGKNTMELPVEAADAHMAHGDHYGACNGS